jgi:hypothetical protein
MHPHTQTLVYKTTKLASYKGDLLRQKNFLILAKLRVTELENYIISLEKEIIYLQSEVDNHKET